MKVITKRTVVRQLKARFNDAETSTRAIVTLLLAAGCEGKTTAILQAAYEVVKGKAEWRILRRIDDSEPLKPAELLRMLAKQYFWLIILDEADNAAQALISFLRQLPRELQGRVHFLMACRDSDWQASNAYDLNWSSVSNFQQERLVGLQSEDAKNIVAAWAAFGKRGLGDLANVEENKRGNVLTGKAREEAKTTQGAFFGALLAVRHGSDLSGHVRLMLERLGQRAISSGGNLRDAIAYIAAMHAEGLEFLSRMVLAQVLACPIEKLHKEVLAPLGQEAAATSTSSFVFTRHRRIAEALVSVLQKDFSQDIETLFVKLAISAIELGGEGHYLNINLSAWRYDLAEHFFDSGRKELALRIARGVLLLEPLNVKTLVNLSKLYRQAGAAEQGVDLFRNISSKAEMDGYFFFEWGSAERRCGDYVAATILAAFSVSDECPGPRVHNNIAMYALGSAGFYLEELFKVYREVIFRDARIAAAVIGLNLRLDPTANSYFNTHYRESTMQGAKVPSLKDAFILFRQGITAGRNRS